MQIEVKYSCALCGIIRAPCMIESRGDDEPLEAWMMTLGRTLSRDHDKRSPGCKPYKLSEVMIPWEDGDPVGKAKPT